MEDDRYEFEVCCENIHYDILSEHDITYTDPRVMDLIDGQDAGEWLRAKKEAMGIALFLFGEVCTKGEVSEFGNLMLSKICIRKR